LALTTSFHARIARSKVISVKNFYSLITERFEIENKSEKIKEKGKGALPEKLGALKKLTLNLIFLKILLDKLFFNH
jgi:hypothetical protein